MSTRKRAIQGIEVSKTPSASAKNNDVAKIMVFSFLTRDFNFLILSVKGHEIE